MEAGDYIAIDWGTTNRRVYAMRQDGSVAGSTRDGHGILNVAQDGFAAEIDAIRQQLGDLPVVAAGMIGSNRGLEEVPYQCAPATLADLARNAAEVLDRVYVVPGVCQAVGSGPDVMRGEEVQVLGALAGELVQGPALFCQPGTHNKWIETDDRRIIAFTTAMTGEAFALLKGHSILSGMLDGEVAEGPAFDEGLERSVGRCDLLTAVFQARAAVLLGMRTVDETASYVSGLLVGADVGSQAKLAGRDVILLSSGSLADLYGTAIRKAGAAVRTIDSHAAFVAGIHAIRTQLP